MIEIQYNKINSDCEYCKPFSVKWIIGIVFYIVQPGSTPEIVALGELVFALFYMIVYGKGFRAVKHLFSAARDLFGKYLLLAVEKNSLIKKSDRVKKRFPQQ